MRERMLASPGRPPADRSLLERVDAGVHGADAMWRQDGDLYLETGLGAIHLIDAALSACGAAEPEAILDLPCGHGRVLRFLRARFGGAEIVASDLDRSGMRFCARRFGAEMHPSDGELDRVELGRRFDLVFCGSLATHLDERGLGSLLALLERSLAPSGTAVVTLNGAGIARKPDAALTGGLAPGGAERLIDAFERDGFAFEPYRRSPGYGATLVAREWLRERAARLGLVESWFGERAWLGYQDAVALRR